MGGCTRPRKQSKAHGYGASLDGSKTLKTTAAAMTEAIGNGGGDLALVTTAAAADALVTAMAVVRWQ